MLGAKASVLLTLVACVRGIYEREAGHYDWQRFHIGEPSVIINSASMSGQIIMASINGLVASVNSKTGEMGWRTRASNSRITSLLSLKSGTVVVSSSDGYTSGLDAESGALKWSLNLEGTVFACDVPDVFQVSSGTQIRASDGTAYTGSTTSCTIAASSSLSSLTTDEGLRISLNQGLVIQGELDGKIVWTREEALAYSDEITVIPYRKQAKVGNHDLSWLIGGYKAAVCLSRAHNRIVVVDIVSSATIGGVEIPSGVSIMRPSPSLGMVDLLDTKNEVVGRLDVDNMKILSGGVHSSSENITPSYRYSVNHQQGSVEGFFKEGTKVYNIELGQPILAVVELSHKALGSVPVLVKGDASVVFKYMNKNLVFLVSANAGSEGITVTALDTVTGTIPMQTVIPSAAADASKLKFVACDNWIVGHYFNTKLNRFEVIAIDLYEKREDRGFYAAATGQAFETTESAYELPVDIHVLSQQYVFPLGPVTALAVTATEQGVTPRKLLFATSKGILAMRKDTWLNPRRPGTSETPSRLAVAGEEALPTYTPVLPVIATDFISHSLSLERIDRIVTVPTHLESTSIMIAVGSGEIFVAPVYIGNAPYDVLSPFFNYWLLYASFSAVVVAVVVTSILANKKELYDKWK